MRIVQSLYAMLVIFSNLNDLSETMIHFLSIQILQISEK